MSNPVTEPIIAPAAAQVVETPTEQADPVEALKVTETHEAPATPEEPTAEVPPHPTPSKSNTTKRLSIFLGKAKNYVDKKVHEKKPTSPKKEVAEPVELTAEPTVETAVVDPVVEATVEPTVEPTAAAAEEAPVEEAKPKSEKRKSILAGIFRSKSPVQKEAEVTPAPETKPDETTVTDKEVQETPAAVAAASATGVVEEPVVEQHHEKENVIDQIKRSPLGKFFNKKKEVEHKEEEPVATAVVEEPVVAAAVVEEAAVEAPVQPEEKSVSRPGSPLGRRITQMFRGFSSKKKVPTAEKEEEDVATTVEPASSSVPVIEPVAEPVASTVEPVAAIENAAVETVAAQEEAKLPATSV